MFSGTLVSNLVSPSAMPFILRSINLYLGQHMSVVGTLVKAQCFHHKCEQKYLLITPFSIDISIDTPVFKSSALQINIFRPVTFRWLQQARKYKELN